VDEEKIPAPHRSMSRLALIFATSRALATTWFSGSAAPIASPSDAPRDTVAQRASLDHVVARSAELDLDGVELGPDRVIPSAGGSRLGRLEQRVSGVPVLGGGVIVQIEPSGAARRVAVDVARGLDVDIDPSLDAQEAESALELSLGQAVPAAAKAKLVVSRMGEGVLLWQLDVPARGSRYWVDAHHGDLVASRSLGMHALGTVYELNPRETPDPIDVELPLLDTAADPIHLNGWGRAPHRHPVRVRWQPPRLQPHSGLPPRESAHAAVEVGAVLARLRARPPRTRPGFRPSGSELRRR